MILQVHDELVIECPHPELVTTARQVQQVMETAYQLAIPLNTEASWGMNWDQLQPVFDRKE